jgi:tetratricopeptide (TPR) repeat protein
MMEALSNDYTALMNRSRTCQQNGDFDGMLAAARRASEVRGEDFDASLRLAECLLMCCHTAAAMDIARELEATTDLLPARLRQVAAFFLHAGRHEDAHRCNSRVLERHPNNKQAVFDSAASSVAVGDLDGAAELYDRLIYLDPQDHDAWYNRSTLRKQGPDQNHVEQLFFVREQLAKDHPGRVPICYALAKELEDLGRHDESFHYLREGAELRRSRLSYDVAVDEAVMSRIEAVHDSSFLAGEDSPSTARQTPVFVLGLPRSGTTLVERIISAHSAVEGLGEITTLALALTCVAGPHADRDELIDRSASLDFARLGELYSEGIDGLGSGSGYLVNKTPPNFLYLGLIRKALPGARVIHMRRHPVDSCYAIYKTLFRMGYPFSYRLQDVGRYYIAYHRLMAHWRSTIPGAFMDVDYERLIHDQEGETRRILEYLELDWEDGCLDFHRHSGPAATASAAQVRQPIYSSSVDLWRKYEKQLTPFANRLQEHGVEID